MIFKKYQERLGNYYRLEDTKETYQQNTIWGPGLDLRPEKSGEI